MRFPRVIFEAKNSHSQQFIFAFYGLKKPFLLSPKEQTEVVKRFQFSTFMLIQDRHLQEIHSVECRTMTTNQINRFNKRQKEFVDLQ